MGARLIGTNDAIHLSTDERHLFSVLEASVRARVYLPEIAHFSRLFLRAVEAKRTPRQCNAAPGPKTSLRKRNPAGCRSTAEPQILFRAVGNVIGRIAPKLHGRAHQLPERRRGLRLTTTKGSTTSTVADGACAPSPVRKKLQKPCTIKSPYTPPSPPPPAPLPSQRDDLVSPSKPSFTLSCNARYPDFLAVTTGFTC